MNLKYKSLLIAPQAIVATGDVVGPIQVLGSDRLSLACLIGLFAAGTFAASSLANNAVTITAHGYQPGAVGQVTTAGTLPTGLSTSTNYYIIVLDANTVSFATTRAHAVSGTAITLSGGVGNSTFTPNSISGATVQAQWGDSLTGPFINIGQPVALAAALNLGIVYQKPEYWYLQLYFTITAGSLSTNSSAYTTTQNG